MLYELTNQQRLCLGLEPVGESWRIVDLPRSAYDDYDTRIYLDGNCVRKMILVGEKKYDELTMDETLSADEKFLLPKTAKGKPVKLSAATIGKRKGVGMAIGYDRDYLMIFNDNTQQTYYDNRGEGYPLKSLDDFKIWVDRWCAETSEADLADIQAFAARPRVHIAYKEGDFFRFRWNRKMWGYGRILLDYGKMRKDKAPFWDIFMGKALVISVYPIVTENPNLTIDDLAGRKALPSQLIADNRFFYGAYEIIGNRPLTAAEEDFPIHYGESLSSERALYFQCGRTYLRLPNVKELSNGWPGYHYHGVGFNLNVDLPTVQACIREQSNRPYWSHPYHQVGRMNDDLRHPALAKERAAIFRQLGLREEDFMK